MLISDKKQNVGNHIEGSYRKQEETYKISMTIKQYVWPTNQKKYNKQLINWNFEN